MSDSDVVARAEVQRQWPVTVTLKHPVEFGSEHISSLTFRRGRMGDLKGMSLEEVPSVDKLLMLASRMCGKPVAVLEMLDGDDAPEVMAIALGFFAKCLGAGRSG